VLRSRRQALQAAPEKDAAAVRAVGGRQSTSMSTIGTCISGVCRIDQQPVVLRSRRQALQAALEKDAAAVRAVGCPRRRRSSVDIHIDYRHTHQWRVPH
jgi:hypothetical protein